MKTLFILLLESSAAMALFYAVYWFFLRKETFFRLNRYYLLGALLLSVLMPLFPVTYTVWQDPSGLAKNLSILSLADSQMSLSAQVSHKKLFSFLTTIYLAGAFFVLLRLILQTISITRTIKDSEVIRNENLTLVKNNRYDLPFSFFHLVFYNPGIHLQEDLPGILAHEKVHIREQHWFDLVIAELWSVFFWFNPFVWLYERAIRQNHEFLADAGVLAQGHPVGRYQALLINQLMGVPVAGITSHMSFAFNTTRFTMMTIKQKQKRRAFRLAFALPVLALLLWAFAEPDLKSRTDPGNSGTVSPSVPAASEIKVSGKILKPDGTPLHGTSVILMGTTTGTMSGADGTFELRIPANQPASLVYSFVGYVTKVQKIEPVDHDVTLKTCQMVEAVIPIGRQTAASVPPPPPPPPPSDAKKVQKGAESTGNIGVPPPPPPPPPSTGDKVQKNTSAHDTEVVFIVVEELPEYPGGEKALQFYIQEMTAKTAQANGIKGKALVEFVVNTEGNVADVLVKSQDNDDVAKAAVKIVSGLKQWKPGTQRGKPVPVKYALELKF